jgi:hypothetical protein
LALVELLEQRIPLVAMAAQPQLPSAAQLTVLAVVSDQLRQTALPLLVVWVAQQQMQILKLLGKKERTVAVRLLMVLAVPVFGQTMLLESMDKVRMEVAEAPSARLDLLARQALCVSGNIHND